MSVDALGLSQRRLVRLTETSDQSSGQRKPSAVERLEADKAKYVKSKEVALTKQLPIIRKPLMPPTSNAQLRPSAPQTMRKVACRSVAKPESSFLNLEHLNNLIQGVGDLLVSPNPATPERSGKSDDPGGTSPSQLPTPTFTAEEEVPAKPPTKSSAEGLTSSSTVTVRRVDVRPQMARPQIRKPVGWRAQLPEQRVHSQLLRLLRPYTQAPPQPLQPLQPMKSRPDLTSTIPSPVKSPVSPLLSLPISPDPVRQALPSPTKSTSEQISPTNDVPTPPSPAVTSRSSVTSRKRRSLTRSKSDVSDRFSRAGADVERFFNYCGLEPTDFGDLAPGSDIASVSRLRSASAPASEHTADGNQEEEEEEAAKNEKLTYGISVIERNARVIKWLYEMRQAKDSTKVANI